MQMHHRKQPPRRIHNPAVPQILRKGLHIQRGRHHHQLQIRPQGFTNGPYHAQYQVRLNPAFVKFIQNDGPNSLKCRVVHQASKQNARGHRHNPGRIAQSLLMAHLVPDQVPGLARKLPGHVGAGGPGRQSSRLHQHHPPFATKARTPDRKRHPCGLAGTRGRPKHKVRACAQRGHNLG